MLLNMHFSCFHNSGADEGILKGGFINVSALVCTWMGDRSGISISSDSPSDETFNRGPLALRQYEFPFGINIVQFSIYNVTYQLLSLNQIKDH